jgi:lipid-binding SYLF domain-containing protein
MRRSVVFSMVLCASAGALLANTAQERLANATTIFKDIMATPDKSIPAGLIEKAECIVIVPSVKKGALIFGGEYGRGFASCRYANRAGWGAPAGIKIEGGSFGLQLGGEATDLVLLVMNRHGMEQLAKSKFTLGGDASVAAGPVGRTTSAETDALMTAEILSWSRSKGVFAGLSLSGATLRSDEDANRQLYGRKMKTQDIIMANAVSPTPPAAPLITALDRFPDNRVHASRQK